MFERAKADLDLEWRDTVQYTRREFLETVSVGTALSGIACAGEADLGDDPLGVRHDFPVVGESTYLDSAYITPSPRQAIEAAHAFAEAKAHDPVSLGDMMAESNLVRQKFA